MFKVLRQSFILIGVFTTILFHMQEQFNVMSLTELYMEIPPTTKQGKRLEDEENLQEKMNETNEITNADGVVRSVDQLSYSTKDMSLNLCYVFVFYLTSRQASIETTLFAVTTLFSHKISAFPINYNANTTQKNTYNTTKKNKQEILKNKRIKRSTDLVKYYHQGKCDSNWFENHEKCYRIFGEKRNYLSAMKYCKSLGSQVVRVNGREENKFIYQLSNKFDITGYLWIRVYNVCGTCEGNYENWYPGHFYKNTGCVVIVNALSKWKNFDCGYRLAFGCEKALVTESICEVTKPQYSDETLLIALLVPIFSCISIAVVLTTMLLVSSVRRADQPFKVSSRYALKKTQRKIAQWDMIDTLRRASLKRRSSKQKPARGSVPSIEVTTPTGGKCANGIENGKARRMGQWRRKATKRDPRVQPPDESPNSSLYELLLRLNGMGFVQPKYNEGIELQELPENTTKEANKNTENNEKLENGENNLEKNGKVVQESTVDLEMVNKEHSEESSKNFQERTDEKKSKQEEHSEKTKTISQEKSVENSSFRNMAFRDSMASIETNSAAGMVTMTSLSEKSSPATDEDNNDTQNSDHLKTNTQCSSESSVQDVEKEDLGRVKNITTVKADVHRISITEQPSGIKKRLDTNDGQKLERTKVVWTYSI